jgi:hypothetical protein
VTSAGIFGAIEVPDKVGQCHGPGKLRPATTSGAGGPHVGVGGAEQQVPVGKGLAKLFRNRDHPVLLTGRVEVVAVRGQGRLNHRPRYLHERTGDVNHDVDLGEQREQLFDGVAGRDDLRIDRAAAPLLDHLQRRLEAGPGAPGKIEGHAAPREAFGDQLAGVAAATVDQYLAFLLHILSPRECLEPWSEVSTTGAGH